MKSNFSLKSMPILPHAFFYLKLTKNASLAENRLMLAPVSKVSSEACAKTRSKVANATSRAVASFGTSVPAENILSRGAFLLRTIRSAVPIIALATEVLVGIPRSGVRRALKGRERFLGQANSASGAIVGAERTFARLSVVVLEAPAFAGLAIAKSLVGAFH